MRKLFRASKPPPSVPTAGATPQEPSANGPENKPGLDPKATIKKEKKEKEKKEKKKTKPSSASSSKSPSSPDRSYPGLSNIPQLARPADAEALATALAAEVDADNADAGIPLLIVKNTLPAEVDLSNRALVTQRRPSVLKQSGRLNSVSSEANAPLVSPPLSPGSPSSNSIVSQPRPKVHFDVSDKIILDAQWYSHQQRFTISSGNFLHFERPPTSNYRFSTTAESIHTKGTLLQLVTSASTDDDKNTWDSTTAVPLYAARYYNPAVTSTERTIYWEAQVCSLGFSKFSSVDHGDGAPPSRGVSTATKGTHGPSGALPSESSQPAAASTADEGLADLGLSRSISHTTHPFPSRATGAAMAVGFIVKCVTPDTVPFIRRRSSLRPMDEFPFPYSTAGDGVFWSSDNGGSIYIGGQETMHTLKAGVGDTVGIGITFKLDPSKQQSNGVTPVPTPPTTPPPIQTSQKDTKELFRRKSSAASGKDQSEVPYRDPKDLQSVPVELFFVVNGEKKLSFPQPDKATNPFDMPIPEYLLGTHDIFPCLCVQGAGVECKTRIGQAVTWQGEGGFVDSPTKDDASAGSRETAKETPKKSSKWWSHLSHAR
ncbi:hypothetical protein Dda_9416 [Drechslerella dactyloides]|uniref:Uncharacterized protein n=1 Tax=Drechslerella dactyloides TaxID=74499 RepID=A0AAD6NEH2_DREDA|nr:hypothetical protein Dda_9416 [Drechslerella dactyloides]